MTITKMDVSCLPADVRPHQLRIHSCIPYTTYYEFVGFRENISSPPGENLEWERVRISGTKKGKSERPKKQASTSGSKEEGRKGARRQGTETQINNLLSMY